MFAPADNAPSVERQLYTEEEEIKVKVAEAQQSLAESENLNLRDGGER